MIHNFIVFCFHRCQKWSIFIRIKHRHFFDAENASKIVRHASAFFVIVSLIRLKIIWSKLLQFRLNHTANRSNSLFFYQFYLFTVRTLCPSSRVLLSFLIASNLFSSPIIAFFHSCCFPIISRSDLHA